jgi:hypothetical protein
VTAPEMNSEMSSEMSSQMSDQYVYFFDDAEFVETDRDGFRRRVMIGDHLEFWFWRIKGGADGSILHKHDSNEQLGIIMRGTLDFRIGDPDDGTRRVLNAGDFYFAPTTIWHGESVFVGDDEFDEVWILDVFAPPRTPRDGLPAQSLRPAGTAATATTTDGGAS